MQVSNIDKNVTVALHSTNVGAVISYEIRRRLLQTRSQLATVQSNEDVITFK